MTFQRVRVAGKELEVSRLSKLMWPHDGITKADLIHYFLAVAHLLLPHLAQRPLYVTRYPDGIAEKGFYQKRCPHHAPPWVSTYQSREKQNGKSIAYIVCNEPATLVWLANLGAIELHPWMSTTDHPDTPDYCVIDLDPAPEATFSEVKTVARLVRDVLDFWDLTSFPKLSGATGMHIYVPLAPKYDYRTTRRFVGFIGDLLAQAAPDKVTTERVIKKRAGRIYVDHLQNFPGKTVIAPYVPRPLPKAPIALPFAWSELNDMHPGRFTIKDFRAILDRPPHLHAMGSVNQTIDHVIPHFMDATQRPGR